MKKVSNTSVIFTVLLLSFFLILFDAQGQEPVTWTWSGGDSFHLKITESYVDPSSGNVKFRKFTTEAYNPVIELYTSEEGTPVQNVNGCYVSLLSDDGMNICIQQVALIATEVNNKQTEKFLLIGTGIFSITVAHKTISGIVYLDSEGKLNQDKSGTTVSYNLKGEIAGGSSEDSFFFRGKLGTRLDRGN